MTSVALDEQARPRKRKRKPAPVQVDDESEPAPSGDDAGVETAPPAPRSDKADAPRSKAEAPLSLQAREAPRSKAKVDPSRFLRSFPNDPALAPLVAAFERGDYAFVRAEAPALAARTKDEQVRRAALELRRRIDPDGLSLVLVGLAFALLIVLALFYWTNKHT